MVETISQRDMRLRSKEIMDAVEAGNTFIVTRGGREMGQLIPLRQRFVTRERFVMSSQPALLPDLDRFQADIDALIDCDGVDPYAS